METNKYKKTEKESAQNVSEPQAVYDIDINALKLAGIDTIMNINNPETLEKAVKGLLKTVNAKHKVRAIEEEETISKEEILAGIREGLLEMKERRISGKKGKSLQELIDEL